jgi:hypothetical protein
MARFVSLLAVGALAVPAAAQYPYPQQYPQPYPPSYGYQQPYSYPNQGYGENVIGQIVDQLLGNRYNVNERSLIRQCAVAATNQAQYQYRGYAYGYGYNNGYNRGFAPPSMRVTAITDVQRRYNGLRVRGLLDTGYSGYQNRGYGYQGGYGYGDLGFRCDVDYRGYVSNVRINRSGGYRRY